MKKQRIWLLFAILLIGTLLAACQPQGETTVETSSGSESETSDHPLSGKKVALVMQQNLGTFSAQYIDGVTEQVEKFGGAVTVFTSEGDLAKMASNLDAAVNQGFDGILIDHGTKEALNQGVENAIEKGIPVVAFDAGVEVDGVVSLEQGDQQMAELTLQKLADDAGGEANIVKIWVAGFAPMERR
ncbi:MAG TPA: substrate-binding domain-containing protein, partial [Planococcus sp. (in: firmicutes)]|nr:substrate-binding domain-containing protein [Planococcus sp. (in: firmicutes)]